MTLISLIRDNGLGKITIYEFMFILSDFDEDSAQTQASISPSLSVYRTLVREYSELIASTA